MLPIVCWDMSSNSSTQTHLEIQSGIQRDLPLFGLNWSFHFAQSPHPCILIWMSKQTFHLLDRVWTLFDTPDRLKILLRPGNSRQESALTWTPPMQYDTEMAAAMEIVCTTVSEFAIDAGVTEVSWTMTYFGCNQRGSLITGSCRSTTLAKG